MVVATRMNEKEQLNCKCMSRDYIIANRPCHALHACETRIVVNCHGSELRFAPIYNLCSWPAHTKTNYIFPDRNLGRKKLPYGLGCFIAVRRLRPRLCFKGKGTRLEMARPIYNLETWGLAARNPGTQAF